MLRHCLIMDAALLGLVNVDPKVIKTLDLYAIVGESVLIIKDVKGNKTGWVLNKTEFAELLKKHYQEN